MGNRLGIYEKGPEYMRPKEYLRSIRIDDHYLIDGLNDQSLRLKVNGGYK